MNPNKYTKKSLEAVQSAQDISVSYQNNCVEQEHLLYALLTQDGSLASQILTKMNIDANAVQQAALHFIEGMPRVSGSGREAGKIYVSPDLDKAFTEAESQAERMKDEYVSVEHLLLALAEKPSSGVAGIFRSFGVTKDKLLKAISEIRGSARVTSQEPEETYDTLSQYYQQSDSTKQDTRLTSFGLPYLQGETWDPITCADGAQQTLGALLYESLYTLGTDFLPRPCLAESASYDAESYALTVTVRSGVTFSDGSALTAWDVVAALRRAKESVRYGQRLAEMDSVSYLGESTLRIYLTRNDPQFAARLDIPIIKGGTQEDTVPVGSGPYRYASLLRFR